MENYSSIKNEIMKICQKLLLIINNNYSIKELACESFNNWKNTCDQIHLQLSEEILRVAVVGTIKSGKSTLVNSLFKGDYLKRGAGVVTSIVTRIRRGDTLSATLYFNSWDKINDDISNSLLAFSSLNFNENGKKFDIRRTTDREKLTNALGMLEGEQLITSDSRNSNSLLLSYYLKGYDDVKDIITSDITTKKYMGDDFHNHTKFAGNEVLAVYLKDILLEINDSVFDINIEIADCQGSDSPNPLHLAMIQDYFLYTNLLIYAISSRTGIRQADLKFLSIIKKMGIIDNILFVLNCDFSEHESYENLLNISEKVKEELSFIKPDPELFTFSCLYNLFKSNEKAISLRDKKRLNQWMEESEFTSFSDSETRLFNSALHSKLIEKRYSLLVTNHLQRLKLITSGILNWSNLSKNILNKDSAQASEIIKKINNHQIKMNQIKEMVQSTLNGGVSKLKSELKIKINRFFDVKYGDVLPPLIRFIRNYNISFDNYEKNIKTAGFQKTLFLIYQEFKQAVDSYITENTNPQIIGFIKKEEIHCKEILELIVNPYKSMILDSLSEYSQIENNLNFNIDTESKIKIQDLSSIKKLMGIDLPPCTAIIKYSAAVQAEAMVKLGFFSIIKLFKKFLKKESDKSNKESILSLKSAIVRIKRETEDSIIFHLNNYCENIKFQYVFKLIDVLSNHLYENVIDEYKAYVTDLTGITKIIDKNMTYKKTILENLNKIDIDISELLNSIYKIRDKVTQTI